MRKLSVNDLHPVIITEFATYAYLKSKQAHGDPLTQNESELLTEVFHTTPLSMLFNSRRTHQFVVNGNGFDTLLDLEKLVNSVMAGIAKNHGSEVECDRNYLFCEILSKIPPLPTTPQLIPLIKSNVEVRPDGTLGIFTGISTEYGTIIKYYQYQTLTYDELMEDIPHIGDGIQMVLKTSATKPEWNQIVRCNGLWEDVMYSYCRSVFGIDYELLFRNNDQNLPPILRDKIIEDIKNILPLLKEKYYD